MSTVEVTDDMGTREHAGGCPSTLLCCFGVQQNNFSASLALLLCFEAATGVALMHPSLEEILASYQDQDPLEQAYTIPASWYVDPRVGELERQNVFGRTWQAVARAQQLEAPGAYVTMELAGEPLVVVRGTDGTLR